MVEKIPAYIFFEGGEYSRAKITSIDIGHNVKSIGNYAFYKLTTSITIRGKIEYVGDYAFCKCSGLTGITVSHDDLIAENDLVIGDFAFAFCDHLTEITIGNGLKRVGYTAFSGCSSLSDIYYNGNKNSWNKISVDDFNEPLFCADIHYFVYVTLLDKNGSMLIRKTQNLGEKLDADILNASADSTMVIYSDKEWNDVFDINMPIDENTTLYAVEIKVNNAAITGTKNITVDKNGISQKIAFVTENQTKYFVCTVKYPVDLILVQITSEYFEIEQNKETIGDYNYLYLTCIYNGTENIPTNAIQIPFELVFGISENVIVNDVLTVEILNDAVLADDNGNSYMFSNIENAEIRIEGILAKEVTIVGEDTVTSSASYSVSVLPENTTNKSVEWSVSDETIATISQDGKLVPLKTGTVTITATAKDGSGIFAKKTVSIAKPVMVTDIIITGRDEVYNVPVPYYYTATVSPMNADNKSVEWSVSDDTIATISQDGKLTPIKTGSVTIRATANDGSGVFAEKTVSVIVIKKVTNINIVGADEIDSETTYTATVLPTDADNKSVEWSVSDDTIATISQDGKLTPIKTGSVTVKATAKDGSGVFAEKAVTVIVSATVTSITSNIGTLDNEFSPLCKNYIIYVPKSATSIKLNAIHSGTLKSTDNKTFINNVAKTIVLSSNETILTLKYSCEGYTDSTYVIKIVKYEGTKTTVSNDGKSFIVTPVNIEMGKRVILALYKDGKFVEMQTAIYKDEKIPFITTETYTSAKVMVWDDLTNLKPVCDVEIVK